MNLQSNMKMNTLLLLATLLFSCNGNSSHPKMTFNLAAPEAKMNESTNTLEEIMELPSTEQPAPPLEIVEKKLIRNGSLDFQTEEVKKTKIEIEKICQELNAYISSENENNYEDRLEYNQLIRVHASQFDALIARIEPLARKIENKNISTQDVTEEFIDVEARLKTKKELENRYREILKQAKTVADVVSIENQVANVRAEIESMEGRLNFLKNQVSFSSLNVTYYETLGANFGFASRFVQSIKVGCDNLLVFIIFLINLWPFVLSLTILVIWYWRRRVKRKVSNL